MKNKDDDTKIEQAIAEVGKPHSAVGGGGKKNKKN